jgi:hypothetical protein
MSDEHMRETGYNENKGFGFYSFNTISLAITNGEPIDLSTVFRA